MEKHEKDTFLHRENGIAFHVLTPAYKDEALVILARGFCDEPTSAALAEVRPEMKIPFIEWLRYIE